MVSGNWSRGWLCFHCSVSALSSLLCKNVFHNIVFSQTFLVFIPILLRYGREKNILFQNCIHFPFTKAHSFNTYCQSVSPAQISTHTREHIHKARLKKQLQFLIKALLIPLCKTQLHKCTQWGKKENEGEEEKGGGVKKKCANARRIITYIMKPSLLFWMSLLMSLAGFGANLNSDLYQLPAADFEWQRHQTPLASRPIDFSKSPTIAFACLFLL